MIKYYFISYIYRTETGVVRAHCLYEAVNKTLKDICFDLARFNSTATDSVVVTCLKNLTKEEYEMLSREQDGN